MPLQEKFKIILANKAFDQLVAYKYPEAWVPMKDSEKELLAILFVKKGENELTLGDSAVLESFDIASKIAPNSPSVYFHQASCYALQNQNIRCLNGAATAIEKATELNPFYINAWQLWGNILIKIGCYLDNAQYFLEALEKFEKVDSLRKQNEFYFDDFSVDQFFWDFGVCQYQLGKHSGEAIDYFHSLEKFRLAEDSGLECTGFYLDYGHVLKDLATLVGREELFIEAADKYEKSTVLDSRNVDALFSLGVANKNLYDFTGSRDYFYKADECFERAVELKPEWGASWLQWAELCTDFGKNTHDVERIRSSFCKYQFASEIDEHNLHILLKWGEAEMLIAAFEEDLDLLRLAEAKIRLSLESSPKNQEALYIYGLCLSEFGRYFSDAEYYQRALDKFHQGLLVDDKHPRLFHGMVLACLAIGEIKEDVTMIERAISYCNEVSDKNLYITPQFLSDWGVALMKLGEITNDRTHIEQAAEKFELAISGRLDALDGDDVELEWLYNYGCSLDFLGDFNDEGIYYEKAIQVLNHVLKIDPEYHHARYNLALSLSHLGELNSDVNYFNHSVEVFQEVIQNEPEDEMAWNDYGLAFLHLAILTYDPTINSELCDHFFVQAEAKFQRAISLGNQHAFYNVASLHALRNNPNEALHYLEKGELADALPPIDDVIHDEWLDSLRDQPAYRLFISRLLNKHNEDL